MAKQKRVGFGTKLYFAATSTGSFTQLASIRSISHSGGGAADVDVTPLDSTSNFKDFERGPVDGGSFSLDLIHDSTAADRKQLMSLYKNGTTRVFKIVFPTTTVTPQMFRGYVNDVGQEIPLDDAITQTASIKVRGYPGYDSTGADATEYSS